MTQPSVFTTHDGLPSGVEGACDARFVGIEGSALNFGAPYHATDQQGAVTANVS